MRHRESFATINGSPPASDSISVADLLAAASLQGESALSLHVQLLCSLPASCISQPAVGNAAKRTPGVGSSVPMSGLGCLEGVLLGVAVAHKRESVGRAIADLKVSTSMFSSFWEKFNFTQVWLNFDFRTSEGGFPEKPWLLRGHFARMMSQQGQKQWTSVL